MQTEFITLEQYHDRIRDLYTAIFGYTPSDEEVAEGAAYAIKNANHDRWTLDEEGNPVLEVPVRR